MINDHRIYTHITSFYAELPNKALSITSQTKQLTSFCPQESVQRHTHPQIDDLVHWTERKLTIFIENLFPSLQKNVELQFESVVNIRLFFGGKASCLSGGECESVRCTRPTYACRGK